MHVNTQFLHEAQSQIDFENGLILKELAPVSEVLNLIARTPVEPDLIEAKWDTIFAYESGAIGAIEALRYLEAIGAFADADEIARIYCLGARAYLGVPTPQPIPPAAPGARSEPSEYLLDVLSSVRERRAVA